MSLMVRFRIVVAAVGLLSLTPMAVSLFAAAVASSVGCALDEGSSHPCVILGVDWGDTLYSMGVAFWLTLFALPLFMGVLMSWGVVEAVRAFGLRGRKPDS
jgi:hypothetical protein